MESPRSAIPRQPPTQPAPVNQQQHQQQQQFTPHSYAAHHPHPPLHHPQSGSIAPPPNRQPYPPPPPPAQSTVAPQYSQSPLPPPLPYHNQGQALPPIQHSYAAPQHSGQEIGGSGAYRPAQQAHEGARDEYQYHQVQQHRSGHATPVSIAQRSYSHDQGNQQRTPSTPVQSGPHPPVPESSQSHKSMEHVMHQYPQHNGVHHGPPPQVHEHHGHYAPPVIEQPYMHQQPVYQQQQQSQQPPPYGNQNAVYAAATKRKPMRAQQACEQCRARKQKCDEGTPCSFCKEQNINCTYRDTPPAKGDKNTEKMLKYLETIIVKLDEHSSRLDEHNSRFNQIERSEVIKSEDVGTPGEETDTKLQLTVEPGKLPGDHRTGPHKLLGLWPSLRKLFDVDEDLSEDYVMSAENRGILRVYGRGEGIDEQDLTQPGGPGSPAHSDDSPDSVPTPREGQWGRGFVNNTSAGPARPTSLEGGLKADGSLDLDSATINALWDSYATHIYPMHPFLDKFRTRRLVDSFISRYSPDSQNRKYASFAVQQTTREVENDRPLKRARMSPSTGNTSAVSEKNPIVTERSPANAIVWLILALGKICQHRDPLPGIPIEGKSTTAQILSSSFSGNPGMYSSSPLNHTIKPSPTSPITTPTAQSATPDAHYRGDNIRSRRSSQDSGNTQPPRNIEIIPGLAYYAKAAEILGDQGDGTELVHAQMFLLAGLYKGQLARVKESMSWLARAGAVCKSLCDANFLFRTTRDLNDTAKIEKMAMQMKDKRNRSIVMAGWSCLQLESDIVAEMRLPSSGITSYEEIMLIPLMRGVEAEDEPYDDIQPTDSKANVQEDTTMKHYYVAQIFLRRRLNDIHNTLYGDHLKNHTIQGIKKAVVSYEESLGAWRALLPEELRWKDNDPPATEILPARLRAKYYGALYVSTRPFLDYALHIMGGIQEGVPMEALALDAKGELRSPAELRIFEAIRQLGKQVVWDKSAVCCRAALQSTVAFDNVPPRLIVTNIHGTAHAQFGNMLVLATTFNTHHLQNLVPKDEFEAKLERTIQFLTRLEGLSPTCKRDAYYLRKIQHKLFPHGQRGETYTTSATASANNSFSR